MLAKIKLKYNGNRTANQLPQRRTKSLLPRTIAISTAVFVLLLVSILYHSIVLEHLDELRQFVKLSEDRKTSHRATEIELEVETSKSFIQIPDSEMVTSDGNYNIKEEEELQSLNIEHGQMKFSHHRLSRGLDDPLDPMAWQYEMDVSKLKSQIRDKRTRASLSELENDYLRCKKAASHDNDCMMQFVKLYKVAKDLSEKLEKAVDMFKDSELLLQQSSKSSEAASHESNKPDIFIKEDFDQENIYDKQQPVSNSSKSLNLTTENLSNADGKSTPRLSLNSTTKAPTTTPKPVKLKPVKISWIIDGNDDVDEEIHVQNSTAATFSAKTSLDETTSTEKTVQKASTTSKDELTADIAESQESTTVPNKNADEEEQDSEDFLLVKSDFNDVPNNQPTTAPSSNVPPTTAMPFSTTEADTEQGKLRKLKFDLLVGKANFSSLEEISSNSFSPTTTTKYATYEAYTITPNWTVDMASNEDAVETKAVSSTQETATDDALNDHKPEVESLHDNIEVTTESHIQRITNSSERLQNATHPLDNPTSAENMLVSFERSDDLNPIANVTSIQEPDLYDPSIWIKKFQEAASMRPHEELLHTFDDKDMQNASKLEPKLNPANMKSFSADDTQLLSLCERMTKRLRNKGNKEGNIDPNSDSFTQPPTVQFTSRGPGGFPVTGESMKATAQFMYNPSFGMPSIPICFYLTPANFRMPGQTMPMWPSPYFGMSNFYGGPSGGVMGSGMGPGLGAGSMYFMPPNFGGTGNFFSGSGAGNSQSNGPNLFPKTASSQKQQPQQFYCTYMQNSSNQGTGSNSAAGGNAVGSSAFINSNFKPRTSNQTSPVDIIYASYVGVPTPLEHRTQLKCELPGHVACFGGNECVRESSWCDNFVDCSDGSDEAACTCQDRLASNRLCDGYADCPMAEDEIGCYGCESYMYSCYANGEEYERSNRSTISMCYNILDRCDGIQNCLNGRDERECSVLVDDLTHNMSHSASSPEGFLYRNHRGEWYPVCNNGEAWATDACRDEGGYTSAPNTTFREIALPGPFIEPSQLGDAHFPHSCQKRNSAEALADHATYVKCAASKCGNRKKNTETSIRPKSKRLSKLKKRIVDEGEGEDDDVEGKDSERIVGGKYSKALEWPFVVAIYRNGHFHCGGTIYTELWIISAAHCAINYQKYYYEVRAGMLRRSSYSAATQTQPVSHIVVHAAYQRLSMRNDLSLLKLAEPLKFNRWVKPICLPDIGRTTNGKDWVWGPEAETLCTAVGWGAIREKGPGSDQLREVTVPIRKRCKDRADQESESVCAGDVDGGRDACQGDSGGPLFCRSVSNSDEWYLAGVVSHGNGCARSGEYGVYTRVALYLDWIEMAVRPDLLPKIQPVQSCPGHICVWGGKRCIPQRNRCNRVADCLGGEDEVGCVYNFIPDVGSAQNNTTTESDYHPPNEPTTEVPMLRNSELSAEATISRSTVLPTTPVSNNISTSTTFAEIEDNVTTNISTDGTSTQNSLTAQTTSNDSTESLPIATETISLTTPAIKASTAEPVSSTTTVADSKNVTETGKLLQTKTSTTAAFEETSTPTSTTEGKSSPNVATTTTTPGKSFSSTAIATKRTTPGKSFGSTKIATKSKLIPLSTTAAFKHTSTTRSTTSGTISPNVATTTTTPGISFSSTTIATKSKQISLSTTAAFEHTSTPTSTTPGTSSPNVATTTTTPGKDFSSTTIATKSKHTSSLPDKFICRRIPQIIEDKHRCDRLVDCEDGSDEENCDCRDYLKGTLSILVCDGKADCEDGSDEEDCGHCKPDEFLCPLSKTCIPLAKRCDNIGDCQFKEDETDCFALTNGKDLHQDVNRRPILSNFGVFTRNTNGIWRIVCVEETSFLIHSAKTAAEACALLGFKGYKFYNTTALVSRFDIVVPIDPDIAKQPRIKAHLAAAVEDSIHYSSSENLFPFEAKQKSRTKHIERVNENCQGLYLECKATPNQLEPQKTLTAGNVLAPNNGDAQKLKPVLKTHLRPNVYVKPESLTQLVDKEEEALDKLDNASEAKKNMSILANNELHEAVEELHWPWLVDVYANGKLWCAGVLLDKYWVMVHESCYFGVRLNTDYVSALFGGGKTKNMPHKSPMEQIRRIDCFQSVPKSDVILYHLERPVRFSHNVLPIDLPERDAFDESAKRECMAVLHDELTGLIKTVPILQHKDDDTCKMSQTACYRLMDNEEFTNLTSKELESTARQPNFRADILSAFSKSMACSQFGTKKARDTIEPIDQGILVCRDSTEGWFPAAMFSYNNTDCRSFKQPFGIRTVEKLFTTLRTMIDQPKCSFTHFEPVCDTFRCPLGKCLPSEEICNKKHDCHDGSDEDAMFCLEYKRGCEPWEMQCRSSKKCIPKSKFCDHVPDCEDYTDEPTVCSCFTYLRATDPGKICDGIRNCWDKSDESPVLCNCTANTFSCGISSNECVPQDFVCDKELDCPNGIDERYCFGIEQPQLSPTHKNHPDHVDPLLPPKYGQVIEQSYGVWHTKCYPRNSPPDMSEIRQICKKLGYTPYRQPSYRLIDDESSEVVETNEPEPDQRGRSFENLTIAEKYRHSTKAVVVSKFSPIKLNSELTVFMKPSRPIAELVRWNATDSSHCFRLEIRCG